MYILITYPLCRQQFPQYNRSDQLGDFPSQTPADEPSWLQSLLIPLGACDYESLSFVAAVKADQILQGVSSSHRFSPTASCGHDPDQREKHITRQPPWRTVVLSHAFLLIWVLFPLMIPPATEFPLKR